MVDILPFNGFVYNKDKIGNISGVISPPYDVISASLRDKLKKITGFIGLTRLELYSRLQVIPHEQTYSKIKEDRLKLLSFCRTNFGPVYTLYNDSKNKIPGILEEAQRENPIIDISAGYDSTLGFKFWRVR